MTRSRYPAPTVLEARQDLTDVLSAHHDVWCVVRSVAPSGLSRVLDFYVIVVPTAPGDPYLWNITSKVALVLGKGWTDRGVRIRGTGMDMGWDTIYTVRRTLGLGEFQNDASTEFRLGYGFDVRYL